MSAPFDTFDYIVYIIPGATILLFLFSLSPTIKARFGDPKIDLTGFGAFVVLAFLLGHILAAAGLLVQSGMDLTKFAFTTQDQICDSNITLYGKKLKDAIKERLQTDMESVCRKGNEKERPAIVGQIITKIYQTKCPEGIACTRRVELFLRLFHLNVLIATTLIIALVILLVAHFLPLQSATPPPNETGSKAQVAYSLQPRQFWLWVVTLVVASIFALGHVSYFSRSYGDELLRTFLLIVPPAAT